jgi:hypothetical protein
MIGSADAVVKQRFFDTFINAWDLNELGQLTPRTDADDDFLLWQKFTHALEESGISFIIIGQTEIRSGSRH